MSQDIRYQLAILFETRYTKNIYMSRKCNKAENHCGCIYISGNINKKVLIKEQSIDKIKENKNR